MYRSDRIFRLTESEKPEFLTTSPGLPARLLGARGDILAGLLLLAGLFFVFRGAFLRGLVFFENDTLAYYYPVLSEMRRFLLQGSLPLWTPYIYGGFPLFADGESGALYPINLVLLLLTSPEEALVWLGPLRVAMAGFFMYLYARTIGLGSMGSTVSALVFAFGGFTVAQLHHLNLSSGAVWLPLILFLLERAYRREGRARFWAVALAGVAFGAQSLALHVQISLMTILFLVLYLAFRTWAFPLGSLLQRLRLMLGALGGTVGLGLGLAAVQWVPLYELSRFSSRAPGFLYTQALEYALPPVNLITFLSPYFFRGPQRVSWAIWSSWETVIYVGTAPLLLAFVAILWVRSRWTAFFAGVGLLSLLVAMANYLPLNLHYLLYRLPWFDALRAPGRFSYLFTFCLACLAGLGARWLADGREPSRPRWFGLLPLGFLGLLGALVAGLLGLSGWLAANRDLAVEVLGRSYLALGPPEVSHLNKWDVIDFLGNAIEIRNWRGQLGLALASGASLLAWGWLPRWRRVFALGLVLLVSADLFRFAQDFHETLPAEKLAEASPAVAFLAQRTGGERVFNVGSKVAEPNRLAPFGVQAAGGYSSLPFQRYRQYATQALHLERPLTELWNVRYLVARQRASYAWGGLSFDPATPLFSGGGQGPSPRPAFRVPDVQTQEVRLLSTMRRAPDIPQGTTVGSVVLAGVSGSQLRIPLLAGVDTAEAAYDRADVQPAVSHQRPQVAATLREVDPGGKPFGSNIYYASVALPEPMAVRGVAIEYAYPSGSLEVYTVALVSAEGRVSQVRPFHLEKFRQVYEGDEGTIYEDQRTLPRAFVVPRAVSLPNAAAVLARLTSPGFDPLGEVLLEEASGEQETGNKERDQGLGSRVQGPGEERGTRAEEPGAGNKEPGTGNKEQHQGSGFEAQGPGEEQGTRTAEERGTGNKERGVSGAPAPSPGSADIREYGDLKVTVEADAREGGFLFLGDSYYPGWRAYVDGREAPIYRADFLFRAVPLPAGRHMVEFRYQPDSFTLGLWISGASAGLLALMLLWSRLGFRPFRPS